MKSSILSVMIAFISLGLSAQVSISTDGSDPDSSAILDIQSTAHGILIPRMTTAERDGIANPSTGLLVFITGDSSFYYYQGSGWEQVGAGISGWTTSGDEVYQSCFVQCMTHTLDFHF